MKKQEEQKTIYELEDFENHCNLWNIVPGGNGNGLVFLRKIIDSIQAENHSSPYKQPPSILLTGEYGSGKNLVCKAIINSLIINDIRECDGRYFENGIQSSQFFCDSGYNTAHIITNIEKLTTTAESVLWRYLHHGVCKYYNYSTKHFDLIQQCFGMILITAGDKSKIPKSIRNAVDHAIELEPYTQEQLKIITHQLLRFCSVDYGENEEILQEIVNEGYGNISMLKKFLKICIILKNAELADCLDMELVSRAKRMSQAPVGAPPIPHHSDDIPF